MSRVLVTGAAGFLGTNLCGRLLERGDDVLGVDDLSTGSRDNVAVLGKWPNFEFLNADVRRPLNVEVDRIFHLACPASPPHYQRDPIRTLETGVIGTLRVLATARREGARLLFTSTSEVYGDPHEHPQREDYLGNVNCTGPRACYDEGKRVAETLCFDSMRQYGQDIRVARIFNTYGPHMAVDDGRVITNFIVQALLGRHLTVYGDGRQTRSFCYVDDLIDGLIRLMEAEGPKSPMNFGNPREVTMLELAEKVLMATGSRSRIVHRPLPADDPKQRRPDISRAQSSLGWTPRVNLEDGLRQTVEHFSRKLGRTELLANSRPHAST